ncbi:MAG TPA: carboxylating nicotinate-nucleotide diphosphorylase [Flavobacteriales bacterium]|nr:carboxylating nicotinate-nucleotide diphosphorylase [Flavobacteriales bacterium]
MIEFIQNALKEDIGEGDHTTLACIPDGKMAEAQLLFKESGVASGFLVAEKIFQHVDPSLELDFKITDGARVTRGDVGFFVTGPARSILSSERLVLNLMQRMSGISTVTAHYVDLIAHTKAKVLDTRKTSPGLRLFEKDAVKFGGGTNHRFGLFDMILIKDNHIDAAGGIHQALSNTAKYQRERGVKLPVEIEVRSFEELRTVLDIGGVDRIMLDNFSVDQTREAVGICNGSVPLESSGGITQETIVGYAEANVDFISVGALTHSLRSLDISLKIKL